MTREQKINMVLERGADDTRRLALDRADALARENRTWGTSEHRQARERIERGYEAERAIVLKLTDDELDLALAK